MITNTEDLKALQWFKDHFNSKAKTIANEIIEWVPLTCANDLKTKDEDIKRYTDKAFSSLSKMEPLLSDLFYEIIDNLILDHLSAYFKEDSDVNKFISS